MQKIAIYLHGKSLSDITAALRIVAHKVDEGVSQGESDSKDSLPELDALCENYAFNVMEVQ